MIRFDARMRLAPAVLLTMLATGCAQLSGGARTPGAPATPATSPILEILRPSPTRAEALLAYGDHARGLGAAEWAREVERLRNVFAGDKSDTVRLQYAMVLSLPNVPGRDLARAQQLIEPLLQRTNATDPAIHGLAALLAFDLAERRRLDDGVQAANQRTRDEQARSTELQNRLSDSEQKLEALKRIEKTLSQRDRKPAGGRARPRQEEKEP